MKSWALLLNKRHRRFTQILLSALVLLFLGQTARAIINPYPLKPLDTSSPRATMEVFMEYLNQAYQTSLVKGSKHKTVIVLLNRATECFDLSEIAPSVIQDVGVETALLLKEIFDRIEVPPYEKIPDTKTDGFNELTSWTVPDTAIKIVKVSKGPRKGEFLFSTGTIARVRDFYDQTEHLPYKPGASVGAYEDYIIGPGPMIPQALIRNLPDWTYITIYDQAIWQWVGVLLTLSISGGIVVMVLRWMRPRKTGEKKSQEKRIASRWSWHKLVYPAILILVPLATEHFVDEQINITGDVLKFSKIFLRTVVFFSSGWAIVVIGNGIAEVVIKSKGLFSSTIDANLVRLLSRLVTLVLLSVLLWNTTDYLGMSLTAVFASAGIVGLGVALAARETLANFFGGVSIFLDRPFKSGDYIVLDSGERGKVVEVGLRSTRMLTRDDIQISIPNSLMTNTKVINESAPRPNFRVRIKVGIAYGSDVDQVEAILLSVAGQNNLVALEPKPRVRFRSFGDSSLEFELLCWAQRPAERGRLIHDLNHQIYKAFNAANIQIPYPQHDIRLISQSNDSQSSE